MHGLLCRLRVTAAAEQAGEREACPCACSPAGLQQVKGLTAVQGPAAADACRSESNEISSVIVAQLRLKRKSLNTPIVFLMPECKDFPFDNQEPLSAIIDPEF